tara:strand:+ start:23 stop:544 length:522 start_codon:yes stop_codon:yes gene_type:complete
MFSLLNDNEMWLDIEGYEGRYSISNMGRVYSHITNKFLKAGQNRESYLHVVLYKDGITKTVTIHILVGNAFIGKRTKEFAEFDHKDRNRQNNCADNIRLATRLEQCENTGVSKNNKLGEKNIVIRGNSYVVRIIRNGKYVFSKSFQMSKYTLDDAVKVRDDFLKNESHGYKNS